MDRKRPGDESFVGAVLPLAQRHLPPHHDFDALRPTGLLLYEGVLEPEGPEGPGVWFDPEIGNDPRWQKRWKSTERVELRLTPSRIVFLRRGGSRGPAATR